MLEVFGFLGTGTCTPTGELFKKIGLVVFYSVLGFFIYKTIKAQGLAAKAFTLLAGVFVAYFIAGMIVFFSPAINCR